jgi:hypothetical protein
MGNRWGTTRHAVHQPRADMKCSAATQETAPPNPNGGACGFGLGTPAGGGGYYDYWGSAHPAGFQAAMADGSVRVIRYTVALPVLRSLAHRADGQSLNAGSF